MNLITATQSLLPLSPQYAPMISKIVEALPALELATSQHNKSSTQTQAVTVDLAGPFGGVTKLRNMRQVLASADRTRQAIEEAGWKAKTLRLRAEKQRQMAAKKQGIDAEICETKAAELESQIARMRGSMQGAIRKLAAEVEQYQYLEVAIRKELKLPDDEPITESHFEADEERFLIKKCCEQALESSRALGRPQIDHGNCIFLRDIGISWKCLQHDLAEFWATENAAFVAGHDHQTMFEMENTWLEQMARKYKGCCKARAEANGMLPIVESALLTHKQPDTD